MKFQINTIGGLSKIILIILTMAFSQQAAALFSDTFTGGHDSGWRFYDPYEGVDGESTLSYDGTNALISIPNGLQHDLYKPVAKNKAPRLLQPVLNEDFEFEVKFETKPNTGTQMQGIIIQQTNDIFLRLEVYSTGTETKLLAGYINSQTGETFIPVHIVLPNGSPNYRRVVRSGDNWKFLYSYAGTDGSWVEAASFDRNLNVTEVGFYAATAGGNPEFLSSIDYFIDRKATPVVTDEDTWDPPVTEEVDPPEITVWNGFANNTGQFGLTGVSQKWANILGHVSSDIDVASLTYTLNGSPEKPLRITPSRRIEKAGDFNIEIDRADLIVGLNSIEIKAKDSRNQVKSETVTITYTENTWPIPYTADWSALTSIQGVESVAHIVDGLWDLTSDGIRTIETGYDRTIAIGDISWPTADYEVTVPFTLHSDFAGVGFAVGWQGHEGGSSSPLKGWPLQALAWIRGSNSNPNLNIVTYGGLVGWEVTNVSKPLTSLAMNERYILKSFSEPVGDGTMSKFHVKFWKDGNQEPSNWDLKFDVPTRDGSVLLVAHKADVTFGNISIELATATNPPTDTTAPVISNIQVAKNGSTATITWETDEPSHSVVRYGRNTTNDSNVSNATLTREHSITLSDLNSNDVYRFIVESADSNSNTASSDEQTFFISASTYELPRNEWHLITLPMNPDTKNKVSDIFGDDELGNYGTSWVVFHYDASANAYVDLGMNGEMEQGMGYWIIQMTSTTKVLGMPAGSASTPADSSGKFEIPLVTKEGSSQFNMIGYPFNARGHFKDARIETNETDCDSGSGCTKDIADAKNNKILHNELWTYSGGSGYIKIDTTNDNIDPWQGFWAQTLSDADGKEPSLLFSRP